MNPLGNRLTFTWLTFLAGGTFFVLMVPLGEGFDEPWHFAYVQHVAQFGKPPLGHSTHISEEIATFLRVHPVSWGLHRNFPTLLSHDEYWRDQRNRDELDPVLANLRFSGEYAESQTEASGQYESHQPPLYYFASAPVFAAASYLFYNYGLNNKLKVVEGKLVLQVYNSWNEPREPQQNIYLVDIHSKKSTQLNFLLPKEKILLIPPRESRTQRLRGCGQRCCSGCAFPRPISRCSSGFERCSSCTIGVLDSGPFGAIFGKASAGSSLWTVSAVNSGPLD